MMVFKFNPNRRDKMKTKKELSKKAFADQAIHTSCDAFFREDFFAYRKGEAGQEYYPELSCGKICQYVPFLIMRMILLYKAFSIT